MKTTPQRHWREYLGNLFADYTNGIDSLASFLSSGQDERLATMEERYIFDLWYFWACNGCQIPRCKSVKAYFSSPQFREYTDKNSLMCNWWNSLSYREKTMDKLGALKELHRANMTNVFCGNPFEWTESITESMVKSVPIQTPTISTYGPDILLVHASHKTESASEKVLREAGSVLSKKGFTFKRCSSLSDCMRKETLILPPYANYITRSVSKNLKWIIFVNKGHECLDWKDKDVSYGIRLLRKRLDFLGLKRVKLLDMSPTKNIGDHEKITPRQIEERLAYF